MNRLVAWFAENHISANLLMALIVAGGIGALATLPQKIFPDIDIAMITVGVAYPGAAPSEVEEGVCVRIEEAIEGVEGIDRLRSTATEGSCGVVIELLPEADGDKAVDEVKNAVDSITTFPDEIERPVIARPAIKHAVMDLALTGEAGERALKVLGERIRDEISGLPGITQVELANARPYEIAIEVPEASLRRHGLTFDQVARAVRRSSLDLPGGSIKTEGGEILLRTKGQAYRGAEFEKIVVITRADGTRVTVGDVARVADGFADTDQSVRFDGRPGVVVRVFRVGEQDTLDVARTVEAYLPRARAGLPEGVSLEVLRDGSRMLRDRLATLTDSGRVGLLLIILVLALFLRPRLAFWVSLGVPISLLGAMFTLPMLGVSIDGVSLFAFIVVLGLLVDDAIVVGESIYTEQRRSGERLRASIRGTQIVAVPVVFGVLTTVCAFAPLLFVPGRMGQIFSIIGLVVAVCLLFSLVESQLILPAHLGHGRERGSAAEVTMMAVPLLALGFSGLAPSVGVYFALLGGALAVLAFAHLSGWGARPASALLRVQGRFAGALERFIERDYRRWLDRALEWRYTTVASGVALLCCSLALMLSGRMRFEFFPEVESDTASARISMPQGTPAEVTREAVLQLERSAEALRAQLDPLYAPPGGSIVLHTLSAVGGQPFGASGRHNPAARGSSGAHVGEVTLELLSSEHRDVSTGEVASRWRELTGPIPDAVELLFTSTFFRAGDPINVQLQGHDVGHLADAAARLRAKLAEYPGVTDISDSFRAGKREVKLSILPSGEALGLTLQDLARQVRQAFYGEIAQRVQRGRDDVRVMVRYPEDERRSLGDLERMRIRAPDGTEVPFAIVARAELGRGFATVRRTDRRRVVNVTAELDRSLTTPGAVLADLRRGSLDAILADYPGITFSLEGEQREQAEAFGAMGRLALLGLLGVFALLAIPLRSYSQPLIIMSVIPFALVGAVAGHLIMGRSLSFPSVMGIVAAAGVVVNASLVVVHYVNRLRAEGVPLAEAVRAAGVARFRPIVLTTVTTFAGLTPLMLARNVQAQQLAPMGVSLAFGVLFATFVTLLIVPSLYLILEDLRGLRRPAAGEGPAAEPVQAAGGS